MKSSPKVMRSLIAIFAIAVGLMGRAEAATITVVPGSQTIAPGATANVDIVLSGLAQAVGGYNFDLAFSNAILDDLTVTVNPNAKMGAAPFDLSDVNLTDGSPIHVELFADAAISEPALAALQGTGFVLASLTFRGLTEGLSPLVLTSVGGFLTNFSGTGANNGLIPADVVNGSICVDDPATPGDRCQLAAVPEPASMLLLGSGLTGLVAARRRRNRNQA